MQARLKLFYITGVFALIAICALIVAQANAAIVTNWTKTYGAILHTPKGTNISVEEEKYFSTFDNQWHNDFILAPTGYLLTAYKGPKLYQWNPYKASLYKINSNGSVKNIQNTHFNAITNTRGGGYVGLTASMPTAKNFQFGLAKYKKDGKLEWKNTIKPQTGKVSDMFLLITTNDNGYVAGGSLFVKEEDGVRAYITKFSENGKFMWDLTVVPANEFATINSIQPTSDGGVVLGGHKKNIYDGGSETAFVSKITKDGTIAWTETWGCDESVSYAFETASGDIVAASNARVNYTTNPNLWDENTERLFTYAKITTINADASQIGQKIYQNLFPDDADISFDKCLTGINPTIMVSNPVAFKINMIKQLSGNGLFIVGTRSVNIKEKKQRDNVWVAKIADEGGAGGEYDKSSVLDFAWEKNFPITAHDNQYGMSGYEITRDQFVVMGIKKDGQRVISHFTVK